MSIRATLRNIYLHMYVFRICINAYVPKRLKPILTNLDPKIRIFNLCLTTTSHFEFILANPPT